jgi:hypothetical protein
MVSRHCRSASAGRTAPGAVGTSSPTFSPTTGLSEPMSRFTASAPERRVETEVSPPRADFGTRQVSSNSYLNPARLERLRGGVLGLHAFLHHADGDLLRRIGEVVVGLYSAGLPDDGALQRLERGTDALAQVLDVGFGDALVQGSGFSFTASARAASASGVTPSPITSASGGILPFNCWATAGQ